MSEPGKSDRWNSLLETLGVPSSESKPVPPPPEAPPAPPKPQAVSMLRPEKAKPAPKPKAAAQPAKSPSYWSRIAGALGLEVASDPEPAPPEEPMAEEPRIEEPKHQETKYQELRTEEPRSREPRTEEPRSRDPRPRERGRYESRARRDERVREEEPAQRPKLDDMFGPKSPDVDVFGLGVAPESPRGREPREPMDSPPRETEDRGSVLGYDAPDGSGSDLPLGFGPSEVRDTTDEEHGPRRRRRRGRGRGRRGGVEGREGPPRTHEAEIEPAGEDVDFDVDRDAEFDLDAELRTEPGLDADVRDRGREPEGGAYPPAGERKARDEGDERGGRTRGRRGRRGRHDRDEGTAERPSPYGEPRSESDRFGPPRDKRPAAPRVQRPVEDDSDDDLDLGSDDGDEVRGGDVPTHKKIPTWDEAVNILIDANMASRANSPDRDHGRGRGRGRGR